MSAFKSIATAIGSIAPTLATMLGGPLAGTAVTALESALGLKPGSGSDGITQAVQGMTPDQIAAVRKADQQHAEILGQQQIDLAKLNAAHEEAFARDDIDDRASARAREIAVKDWVPAMLAILVTVGFFSVLGYMIAVGKPKEGGDALLVMLGSLGAAWTAIIAYYFGSSMSSAKKDATLAEIAKS